MITNNNHLDSEKNQICQCCGMPLEDGLFGKNCDGTINEDFCKWCYADGNFTYSNIDELIEVCVKHMANEQFTEEQARSYMKTILPELKYWKNKDEYSDNIEFENIKRELIEEINLLNIDGMPKFDKLYALVGGYVNLEYPLPSGINVKFLDDNTTYFGNQLQSEINPEICFGVVANAEFVLIASYKSDGIEPHLILYKKR